MTFQNTAGYDVLFRTKDVPVGMLTPRALAVFEEISGGTLIEVTLTGLNAVGGDVHAQALLRTAAEVVILRQDTLVEERAFTGLITRVKERARSIHGGQELVVTIESPLTVLDRSSDYRIYQSKSSQDIVTSIFQAAGLKTPTWKLSAPPPTRDVCTQFGETMMAFASRILEEDGIFYYLNTGSDGPEVVFGDSTAAYGTTTPPDVRFEDAAGMATDDAIVEVTEHEALRPGKVTLRDHDFTHPTLDPSLEVSSSSTSAFDREHYEYPGRYTVPAEGTRRAGLRVASFAADSSGVDVRGQAPRLSAGHWFTLKQTPDGDFDGDWVVLRAYHSWSQGARLSTSATLIPKTQTYRPVQKTPKPIAFPCTAMVDVPPGQEIYPDAFGRVRARFQWDRYGSDSGNSSFWIRVGQMHSSGSVAVPRKGWELFIDFEDGDPDKPIALGRLYNAADPPAGSLPGDKTVSMLQSFSSPGGGGQNQIRMDDASGTEMIAMHAQKDMNLVVANDKQRKVTNNSTFGVTIDDELTVGANQTVQVGATENTKVGGSQTWSVGAVRSKSVTGNEKYEVTGSRSVTIGAVHMTTTPQQDQVNTSGSLSETVGGAYIEAAAMGTSIATAGSCSILVGAAKLEAVATGKSDTTLGAKATTVGGALLNVTPKDVGTSTSGSRTTTVGGAWMLNAGGKGSLTAKDSITINVGGALIVNGTSVVFKVGDSNVTVSGGAVVLTASSIKLTATGPNAELSPAVASK